MMGRTLEPDRPERRRFPRVPIGWVGEYLIPSRPDLGWGDCLVLDVSDTGIGLMLFGPWPEDVGPEVEVLVRLEPKLDADPVDVLGTVRNTTSTNVGELRIGIELESREGSQLVSILGSFSRRAAALP
jgi:hypothetical protein